MSEENKPGLFTSYVYENKEEYKYILKIAADEVGDNMLDKIEAAIVKYEPISASAFRKTPIQQNPLDFPNVSNTAVNTCDISLKYPASLDFMKTLISNALELPLSHIAVYSENDPRQIETDLFVKRSAPDFKDGYKTALGNDPDAAKDVPYGETQTTGFLKELEKVSKERQVNTVENELSKAQTIDHTTLPDGYHDYNSSKNVPNEQIGLFGRTKKPDIARKMGAK